MALTVLDSGSVVRTLKTTEVSSTHTPHHKAELVDSTDVNIITANTGPNVPIISSDSVRVNAGNIFFASISAGSTTASSMSNDIGITVPAGKTMHLTDLSLTGLGDVVTRILIREAPTLSGGTVVTAYNRDRSSATAATVVVKTQTSLDAVGTTILNIGSANGAVKLTGQKLILKANTTYSFSVQGSSIPVGTTAVNPVIEMAWYEV